MARRSRHDPKKRRQLPEPRYRKTDEFKELTGDDSTAKEFLRSDTGESILSGSAVKGFGLRRSQEPFEKAKEREEEERSLEQLEYGKKRRTRRRTTKRT